MSVGFRSSEHWRRRQNDWRTRRSAWFELFSLRRFDEDDLLLVPVDTDEATGGGVVGDALAGEGDAVAVDEFEDGALFREAEAVEDAGVVAGDDQEAVAPEPAGEAV